MRGVAQRKKARTLAWEERRSTLWWRYADDTLEKFEGKKLIEESINHSINSQTIWTPRMQPVTSESHTKRKQSDPCTLFGSHTYSLTFTVDTENINYRFLGIFWACNNNPRSWRKGIGGKTYTGCRETKAGKPLGGAEGGGLGGEGSPLWHHGVQIVSAQ